MFRSIRRNFDYNLRIFLFGSFHRIAETFFDFFFFFCFQHFSNSIRLSLLNYLSRILFAATVYETCASHVPFVRPAPTFFEIFYSIENEILIRALSFPSSSNCFYPSLGSFIFQRDGPSCLFNFTSSNVRSQVERNEETWRQLGRIDGSVETVVSVRKRVVHAHKYRNVVVRTDSGTEQSPFRNTCYCFPLPLNQISPTCFFARPFSTDRF